MSDKVFVVLVVLAFGIPFTYFMIINPLININKMTKEARKNLSAKTEDFIQKHYDSPTEHICIGDRVFVVFHRPMSDGTRNVVGILEDRRMMYDRDDCILVIRLDDGNAIMSRDTHVKYMCRIPQETSYISERNEYGRIIRENNYIPDPIMTANELRKEYELQPVKTFDKKGITIMTCREKLKLEHPNKLGIGYAGGCKGCPGEYGYLDKSVDAHKSGCIRDCTVCWDQEAQGEVTVNDNNQQIFRDLFMQAMNSINGYAYNDNKSKYKECATEMYALYTEFRRAGFDNNQAFELTRTMLGNSVKNTKE